MLSAYQPTKISERISYNPPWPALYLSQTGEVVHATNAALNLFDLPYEQLCNRHISHVIQSDSHDLAALLIQAHTEKRTIRDSMDVQIGEKRMRGNVMIQFFERVNLYIFVVVEPLQLNKKDALERAIEKFLGSIVGDTSLRHIIHQLQEHFAKVNVGVIMSLLETPVDTRESYPVITQEFAGFWVFGKQHAINVLPDPKVLSYVANQTSAFQSFDDLYKTMSGEGRDDTFFDMMHRFSITGMHKFMGFPIISQNKTVGFALFGGPFFDEYDIHQIHISLHYLQGSITQFHARTYLAHQLTRLERLNSEINKIASIQHEQEVVSAVCRACQHIFDTEQVLFALHVNDTLRLIESTFAPTPCELPFDTHTRELLAENFYTTELSQQSSPILQSIAASTKNETIIVVPLNENKRIIGYIGICHPFSELLTERDVIYARQLADFVASHYARIRLTTALNESEQRYRFLLNETSMPLLVTDAHFRVTHMNHAARRMIGVDDDSSFSLLHILDESNNVATHTWATQVEQLNSLTTDKVVYLTRINNLVRHLSTPVELEAQILRQDNQVEYMITLRDIQERITIEQEFQLRERELDLFQHITSVVNSSLNLNELLNRALDILDVAEFGSMTAIILINEEGVPYIAAHRRVPALILETSQQNPNLLWSAFDQILPDNEKSVIPNDLPIDSVLTNQMLIYIGHIIGGKLTADEKIIGLILAAHPYKSFLNFSPRDLQILNAVSNQLSRAVTNAKLHTSLQKAADRYINLYEEAENIRANLALIINSSPDVLMLVNRHSWHMRILNETPLNALQYTLDTLMRQPFHMLCPPDTHDVMFKHYNTILETTAYSFEMELLRGDGQRFHALISTNVMNNDEFLFVVKDITPMRQLENRIKQREKLALIGQMIASVAHELNNPIGVIRGIAQLQLLNQHDPQTQNDFEVIEQTSQRAGRIVQQLRSLLQPQQYPTSTVNLYQCIMRIIAPYIQSSHSYHVTIDFNVLPDDYLVIGVESQLEQVFINLIDNAIRAMQQIDTERKLTISMHKTNQHVVVNIDDSGPGIAPHIRKTIFEPFVTTRSVGEGMGLGLAIVHAIVMQHHGKIENYGVLPRGTRFTLTLPTASAPRLRIAKLTHEDDIYATIIETLRELSDKPIVEVNNHTDTHDLLIIDENALTTTMRIKYQHTPMCIISRSGALSHNTASVVINPLHTADQIRQQISTLLPHIAV